MAGGIFSCLSSWGSTIAYNIVVGNIMDSELRTEIQILPVIVFNR